MPLIKKNKIRKNRSGLTLVETIIASVVSIIVIMGLPIVMADNQKSWNKIYNKANYKMHNNEQKCVGERL